MAWDPKTDGSCNAFGAAAVMRMPTRVRISWADDTTLKIETDNGQQTRLLHFGAGRPPGAPSLQGDSAAAWQRTLPPNNPFGINFPGGPPPPPGGSLRVVTTNLSGGWLRPTVCPTARRPPLPSSSIVFAYPTAPNGSWSRRRSSIPSTSWDAW
jgi:hypothetical protein